MKPKDTFQSRLEKAIQLKNIKPVELHEITGISESLLSKYLSGNAVARQKKLTILADALNVNEVWLMGYDVSMKRSLKSTNLDELDNNYFEFITEDDAMYPLLDIGDIALIYKQNEIDNILTPGKGTYLIKLDNTNTIRKIVLNEEKNCYTLIAMNACYKTIDIAKDDFNNKIEILGKVVKAENKSAFK